VTDPSPGARGLDEPQWVLSVEQYERFVPLVHRAAIRFARQTSSTVSVGDIIGAALVGLVDAVKRADPAASPEQVDQYIWYRIRSAMIEYVRAFDARARNLQIVSQRLTRAIRIRAGALGRAPDEAEIAAAMNLEIPAYRRTLGALARGGMMQLQLGQASGDPDDAEADAPVAVEPAAMASALAKAVEELPLIGQHILALHHQEDCSPREIAAVLDLTEARVLQLHAETIHRLRAGIGRS
jgi:RNA polymerase sigma factor for flagellar operon FliA